MSEASFEEGSKCIVVFSSIISVTHFGNVQLSILRSILVMCSVPSSFQQCPDAFDRIRVNLVAESPFVSLEDFMLDIRSQRTVCVETVGNELRFTRTSDVILDKVPDRRSRDVRHDFGNDVSASFNCSEDSDLIRPSSLPMGRRSDIGLIGFNDALKKCHHETFVHSLAYPLHHRPSCLLTNCPSPCPSGGSKCPFGHSASIGLQGTTSAEVSWSSGR